jgi:signal peptidase I
MREDTYQKKEIGGGGEIIGNKFDMNYKGSNKSPDGYYWVVTNLKETIKFFFKKDLPSALDIVMTQLSNIKTQI